VTVDAHDRRGRRVVARMWGAVWTAKAGETAGRNCNCVCELD
jgi:hypothetical protein